MKSNLENLILKIESENFKGYDPFDALNSPILKEFSFNNKLIRIAFIQFLKKFPLNIRPLLWIKKDYNPKGLGLILWGYAKLYMTYKNPKYLENINFILNMLEELKSSGYSGHCWGYNFDWQSRAFYLPKFTPTVVNTAFIGHALIDTYLYTKSEKALNMAISTKDFILNDLHKYEENSTICFSYSPKDYTKIHNANLLGASLLIRLYKYTCDDSMKDAAFASLAFSMKHQREDGSWYYAETNYQKWIDSFHTGFNLQSLKYFLDEGLGIRFKNAFYRGVNFYKEKFFLGDGCPKYYHDRLFPIDVHSSAQAIVVFSRLGKGFREINHRIVNWMIKNMQDESGYFYFQRKRFYSIKIPYMRWSQAWAFHALTENLISSEEK